jgi:hypothetical protein
MHPRSTRHGPRRRIAALLNGIPPAAEYVLMAVAIVLALGLVSKAHLATLGGAYRPAVHGVETDAAWLSRLPDECEGTGVPPATALE